MPTAPYLNMGFKKGFNPDGGPFQVDAQYYRDGKNIQHNIDGSVENRRGIELLTSDDDLTVKDLTDASNFFIPSVTYAEFTKANGTVIRTVILRYGYQVRIYANDGSTYTSSLENLDIKTPDFTFTLTDVSDESFYYRTNFSQYDNTVIMTNSRSPIYKLVWGGTTETFNVYKITLSEVNEDLFDLPRAITRGKDVTGWYSRTIPMKTGSTSYTVDFFFGDAAPGYTVTIFKETAAGAVSLVDSSAYTYAEAFDSGTNTITSTLTYSAGVTGEVLRIYFGQTSLSDQNSSLAKEVILVSDTAKDYQADNSYAPRQAITFGGRAVFSGIDGPLDETEDATYPALGNKFNKMWISGIFPKGLERKEATVLNCKGKRGILDVDDNVITAIEGGIAKIDDASKILDMVAYGNSIWVAAENGVWSVTGPDEFFHIQQLAIKRELHQRISCREPIVVTDAGVYVFTDTDVFLYVKSAKDFQVHNLTEQIISSTYRSITEDARKQAYVRYDSYNKKVKYCYTEDTTKQGQNKYKVSGAADRFLVFDEKTVAWFAPWDITAGVWSVFDTVTIPADSHFGASDPRLSSNRKVNLAVMGKKNGSWTDLQFGIWEGKAYCADYYDHPTKAAFESYMETVNSMGIQSGRIASKVQVARLAVFMKRQEQDDADGDGYFAYPGALYLWRRWDYADADTAGPLYENVLNAGGTAWTEGGRQIYFPFKFGIASFGGARPPKNVIVSSQQKLRGRGNAIALKLGNKFGDTDLTNTLQEQEKGWGVYGYEIDLKEYK